MMIMRKLKKNSICWEMINISNEFIPLSVPFLKGNELKYVTEAIQCEWVSTAGPYVEQFENSIADYVHTEGAVACLNGTAGLHIALLLAGVNRHDAVIVPTLTFIASVNPIHYIGAEPIFVDCDDSLCIDPLKLRQFCETECYFENSTLVCRVSGKKIKALVVVHVFGNIADMEQILDITQKYNITVIEDAAEAIGTRYDTGNYKGKYAGTLGNIGVFSFNGNKIITTGGGGMIIAQENSYLRKAKHLTTQAKTDEVYYTHDEIGFNYRLTNIQAALGLAQIEKLEDFIVLKKLNYGRYFEMISEIKGLSLLPFRNGTRPNYWFYSLLISDDYPFSRDELIRRFAENNIQTRPIWNLAHEQSFNTGYLVYNITRARYYWERIINLPCSTNLNNKEIERVVDCLRCK